MHLDYSSDRQKIRKKTDIEYGLVFLIYETCTQRVNSQTRIYHHYIVQILHLDCNELNRHKPPNHIKTFQVFTVQTVQTVVFHTLTPYNIVRAYKSNEVIIPRI